MDNILANLIDTNRTRRQVVRQLIIMDLVTDSKQLKKGISGTSRARNRWTEEQEAQLVNLYELHRDDAGKTYYLIPISKCAFQIDASTISIYPNSGQLPGKAVSNTYTQLYSSGAVSGFCMPYSAKTVSESCYLYCRTPKSLTRYHCPVWYCRTCKCKHMCSQ